MPHQEEILRRETLSRGRVFTHERWQVRLENGGTAYRRQAGNFGGFSFGGSPCGGLCLCYLAQLFCCGGRMPFFFCC